MLCLWKHIDRLDRSELVSALSAKQLEVAGESRGMAAHVDDLGWPSLSEYFEAGWVAANSGWIQQNCSVAWVETTQERG